MPVILMAKLLALGATAATAYVMRDSFASIPGAIQGVLGEVIVDIDTISAGLVERGYLALVDALDGFIVSVLSVSLMLFGLGMLMGWIQYPIKELAKKLLVWTTVLALIYNWGFFELFVYQLFTTAPQALAGIIVGTMGIAGDGSIISTLDGVLEKGFAAAGDVAATNGYVAKWVMWAVIVFGTTLICGYAVGLICISKIGLTVVLILGPLFLLAFMFESTKHLFQSWLQQILNYGLITVLTSVILAFFIQMLSTAIPVIEPGTAMAFSDIAKFMMVGIVMLLVLFQVPATASGLAGGLQLTTLGAFSGAGRMGRNAGRGLGRGASNLGRKVMGLRRGPATHVLTGG